MTVLKGIHNHYHHQPLLKIHVARIKAERFLLFYTYEVRLVFFRTLSLSNGIIYIISCKICECICFFVAEYLTVFIRNVSFSLLINAVYCKFILNQKLLKLAFWIHFSNIIFMTNIDRELISSLLKNKINIKIQELFTL